MECVLADAQQLLLQPWIVQLGSFNSCLRKLQTLAAASDPKTTTFVIEARPRIQQRPQARALHIEGRKQKPRS